jgi:hypothetical protein
MKRSGKVQIALVAGLAMSGCGRKAQDPCSPQTFNAKACQDAVSHNGYYDNGQWIPHTYTAGYSSYYAGYNSYVRSGGTTTTASPSESAKPATTSGSPAESGTVSRGIFGSSAGEAGE